MDSLHSPITESASVVEGAPIVEVRRLNKSFGDRKILKDFNMTVSAGEFVAIVGASGSGKSTLLNIIGLLDEGETEDNLRLFGQPAPKPRSKGARMLLRKRIAYLFQEAALIDEDTVEANLKLAQHYADAPSKERQTLRTQALKEVGLSGMERQKVFRLSGGEQQRLALACIRLRPSELVLADEPTGSLDPGNRDAVIDYLERLTAEGKTVIVVTHDPAVAKRAHRVVSLTD